MFVFLVLFTWSFMMTNHKYRKTLDILKAFKKQSADEIFSLQQSLSQYMYEASLTDTFNQGSPCSTLDNTSAQANTAMNNYYNALESKLFASKVTDTSVPFTVILKAVKNYCDFHKIPMFNVSLDDVSSSSAGIKGWSKMLTTTTTTTTTTKTKGIKKHPPSEYNLFIKKNIADIKRGNPDIAHKTAFIQATKLWQRKKA